MRVEKIDGTEIVASSGSLPAVHLFRFKDIEQAAQPDHLRRMFDALHGNDVQLLSEKIDADIRALKKQRGEIIAVAAEVNDLTLNAQSPLRQYVRRQQQFDSVNTAAAKAEFEKIDKASNIHRTGNNAVVAWDQIAPDAQLEENAEQIKHFAESHRKKILTADGSVVLGMEDLATLLDHENAASPVAELLSSMEKSKDQAETVKQKLDDFTTAAEVSLKATNDEASKKGIVVVTNAREVNRKSFEEATTKLETYRELIEKMNGLMVARKTLFNELRAKCIERSRIRRETASRITNTLAGALDRNVLVITAEAQERHDTANFREWLSRCGGFNYARETRIDKLITAKLLPDQLREALLSWEGALEGKPESVETIRATERKIIDELLTALRPLTQEKELVEGSEEVSYPAEITDGLMVFSLRDANGKDFFNLVLELDEILIDDRPVILLNDRPAGRDLRMHVASKPTQAASTIGQIPQRHTVRSLGLHELLDHL